MIKICKACVLPETFPRTKFDARGVCNYCQSFKGKEAIRERREQFRQKFQFLLGTRNSSMSSYDVLMAYSGGKDSTFTLDLLKTRRR